ncbi:MAG: class I SAM-dependent methyltransferase [Planctomycetota bacterium]|jgi:SAM-dependent methyltransferase
MSGKPLGQQSYEQFARRYAKYAPTKPHNAYYERPATLSLLPDVRGRRVLDAGCGPGIYASELLDRGAEVVAFDVTPEMVQLARDRVGDRATVLHANLEEPLAFAKDGEFDLVLCPLALDYVADWRPLFDEFQRVLRPGGLLLFSSGHPMSEYVLCRDRIDSESVYFDVEQHTLEWGGFGEPRPRIRFYRRPLAAMLNPLVEAGFLIDRLLEPKPTEEFRHAAPDHYAELMREPCFLCVRARKPT